MKLTKLQQQFIDEGVPKGAYVAFPMSIFKSRAYKRWKAIRQKKIKENAGENPATSKAQNGQE